MPPFPVGRAAVASLLLLTCKAKEQVTTRDWAATFPLGDSCGKGVQAPPSGGFDTFEPVACSSIGVTVDDIDNIEFVNWT
ncbi:hypothetical protein [Myxococcus sp. RHSTA-1-4]|uniref:hypothetical protein n=1 Tax=Myxococcus sp. RHSTA-1-4 TaxID=2874601 RepID=UPI001CBBBF0E|nr:hypothetical protein [Myxococcus sp. RHSTA-1-4]MBZ4422459.1 hypothetical protein [Myxococcus sp. RHSTA-1-4]